MRDRPSSHRATHGNVVVLLLLAVFLIVLMLYLARRRPPGTTNIRQMAQFHSLEAALELFDSEFGRYPTSDATDDKGLPYCGAMKLAEALVGQDLMGWHPASAFRLDGTDPNTGGLLYTAQTLAARPGAFLLWETANVYRLSEIYGNIHTGPFRGDVYVLCDTYERERPGGAKTGMPILYFKANPKGTSHDANDPDNPASVYNYRDNLALLKLGVPGDPNAVHPLADPRRFYLNTRNEKVTQSRPYRADSYILISAGWDGLYGTADDICNFDWQYREQ